MSTDRNHIEAQRIACTHLADAEFSIVYEDEDLEDMTENEWRQIHDLITRAKVVLPDTV